MNSTRMKAFFFIVASLIFIVSTTAGVQDSQNAREELTLLREMLKEDRSATDALVLYPDDVRNAIFRVSMHPELLAKVAAIQQKSSAAFPKIISNLTQQDKGDVWRIVRYSGLVKKLIDCSQSEEKVGKVTEEYEPPIREAILRLGTEKEGYQVLVNIDLLNQSVQKALETLTENYPSEIQSALRKLIELPETLSILNDNMPMTILVGEIYKKDPAFSERRAAEVGEEVKRKNAQGIEDWKKQLESTPQAFRELEKAVRELAIRLGYDPAGVLKPVSETEAGGEVRPYPYWYGYPESHTNSQWYPYRYWHYCGYFYGTDGQIVLIGTPSTEYLRWHFQNHRHLSEYPYLTDQLLRYYENHREFSHTFNAVVGRWMDEHGKRIPGDWLKPDANRVVRLRAFGDFQEDFIQAENQHPGWDLSEEQFLSQNSQKYAPLIPRPLTQQAQSMALTAYPPPTSPGDSEALKLTLPPAYQWQAQADEYLWGSWDSAAMRRYYESRVPD